MFARHLASILLLPALLVGLPLGSGPALAQTADDPPGPDTEESPGSTSDGTSDASDGTSGEAPQAAPGAEDKVLFELNLGIYREVQRENSGSGWLIPFYHYSYDKRQDRSEFLIWPLLSGNYVDSNSEYWFSFPLLSWVGAFKSPERQSWGFVSLPLLTQITSESTANGEDRSQWASLLTLTLGQSQTVRQGNSQFHYDLHASMFSLSRDIQIDHTDRQGTERKIRINRWAMTPTLLSSLKSEEIELFLFQDSRWNDDRETLFLSAFGFSLFNHHVRHNPEAPGAFLTEYEWILTSDHTTYDQRPIDPSMLENTEPTGAIAHFGFLDPLINVETSSDNYLRIEFQPLFSHRRDEKGNRFHVIPLMTSFGSGGVKFDPLLSAQKMFPLAYWDENKREADILWPLIKYVDKKRDDHWRLRTRLLFDYNRRGSYTSFDLLEGILYEQKTGRNRKTYDVLGGALFSSESRPEEGTHRWEILKGLIYGEEETRDASYIKVLLFKFKVEDKTENGNGEE